MDLKQFFKSEEGISPIVATLVLVVVAIAGAAGVGTIMGSFSSDVSDSANADEAASSAATEILVAGSTTVQPVSELLAKAYMEEHPGVKITVQAGGSSAGIASAGMGIIDIGAASKFIPESSQKKFPDLQTYTIGGSAVVAIVNDAYNTSATDLNITTAQLTALYNDADPTATKTALVGTDELVVYHRTEGSGTEETWSKYLDLGGDNVDDAAEGTDVSVDTATGNQGVLDAVKGETEPAIGFVDYGFAAGVDGVHILVIDGFTASSSTVKAEVKERLAENDQVDNYVYGLCRPLNYVTNGEPSSVASSFIQFAMSPASIEYFSEAGYYSITELQ